MPRPRQKPSRKWAIVPLITVTDPKKVTQRTAQMQDGRWQIVEVRWKTTSIADIGATPNLPEHDHAIWYMPGHSSIELVLKRLYRGLSKQTFCALASGLYKKRIQGKRAIVFVIATVQESGVFRTYVQYLLLDLKGRRDRYGVPPHEHTSIAKFDSIDEAFRFCDETPFADIVTACACVKP